MAVLQQFLLNLIELPLGNTDRRKDRLAVLGVLSDHQVSAAEVLEVVGERREGANDGVGIPARLEFDAFNLNNAGVQQILDTDGQAAREDARRSIPEGAVIFGGLLRFLVIGAG